MRLLEARILKKWFRPLQRGLVLGLLSGVSGTLAQGVLCGTPGKDGVGTGLTGVVNTYYPGSTNASAGATSISVGIATGASTAITTGDLLLVIQMQDAALNTSNDERYGDGTGTANNVTGSGSGATNLGAGKYEYVVAKSAVSGGSVTVAGTGNGGGLFNSYSASTYSSASAQKTFQVIRVPQYSSVTLGGTLTAPAWNGKTGGIVAIDVSGNLSMGSGGINVSGLGFRGGAGRSLAGAITASNTDYRNLSTLNAHAQKGEGVAGTPAFVNNAGSLLNTNVEGYPSGSSAQGAPGNAGGGGTDGNAAANDQNSGGGGGANSGVGGRGGNTWSTNRASGGYGGASVTASATRLVMGGGGGAGTTNNGTGTPGSGFASSGAVGGGLVLIRAGTVSGSGSITASGADANNTVDNDGSGGGGAGGSVLVLAQGALPSSLTINVNGGKGGTNTGGAVPHGPGGGGGGGVVALSGTGPTITMTGGANGTTAGTPAAFGATPGSSGQTLTITGSDVPGALATALCSADLTIDKSGSSSVVQGSAASYTVTVWNKGPNATSGATVSDVVPSNLTAVTWTCTAAGSAKCSSTVSNTSGNGNTINLTTGALPVNAAATAPASGSYLVINVTGTASTVGSLTNIATVAAATGVTDAGGNNSSSQTTLITNANLTCSTTMYGLFGSAANGFRTIATLTPSGTVGSTIATVPTTTAANVNASLGVSVDGSKFFVGGEDSTLRIYDVGMSVWTSTTIPGAPGRTLRLGVTKATAANPSGVGFISVDTRLWSFQTTSPYTVAAPVTITYTDASGLTPVPTTSGSGDFFADDMGNLYLSVNPSTAAYLDTFKIRADGSAVFLGRINNPTFTTDTFGGYAALGNQIYGSSSNGRIIQYDLGVLTSSDTAISAAARANSDLASCVYPTLQPSVAANKTVSKVAGSAGATVRPGDTLEYTIIARNTGTIGAPGVTLQDDIPAGTSYVVNSTTLNTAAVADAVGGVMPFVSARNISSPASSGAGASLLLVDATPTVTTDREATVSFRVTVNATSTSVTVNNQGTIAYSGDTGSISVSTNAVTSSVIVAPVITLLKLGRNISASPSQPFIGSAGSIGVKPGETVEYCIVYGNTGGAASNFVLQDYVPLGMVAQLSAYGTSGTGDPLGLKYAADVALAVGNADSGTVTPKLTSKSGDDVGTLSTTPVTNPGDPAGSPQHPGVMTLTLPTVAANSKGTVCFQARVP